MSISGLGDEREDGTTLFPGLPAKPATPPGHADVIRQALRRAADEAYPDDNAAPYQEALRALAAGEITIETAVPPFGETGPAKPCGCGPDEPCDDHADKSVVKSRIGYTGLGGEPLTVSNVTRFEVIDGTGRVLSRWDVAVELSVQDSGRTLKVFLRDAPGATR